MGMMLIGRGKHDLPFAPTVADQQPEPARDADERPQVAKLSEISSRASHAVEGTQRLKEIISGIAKEPRAAINEIEDEIGLLRALIAEREQTLIEAVEQHANLSKEAVHGIGVVRRALSQIRDAFNATIRPMPGTDVEVETTGTLRRPRPGTQYGSGPV